MSSPAAGKFQDHYAILGIEPRSDSETIQRVYAELARKFHPNNPDTGNKEKFDAVNQAYEVLSDPALRQAFDKVKGVGQEQGPPKFTGLPFFEALGDEVAIRSALLCVLYDRRRTMPTKPSLSVRNIENMLEATSDQVTFALWYLKQRGFAVADDKSSVQITVDGIVHVEDNPPPPDLVMPFIQATALLHPYVVAKPIEQPVIEIAPPATPEPAPEPPHAVTKPVEAPAGAARGSSLRKLIEAVTVEAPKPAPDRWTPAQDLLLNAFQQLTSPAESS